MTCKHSLWQELLYADFYCSQLFEKLVTDFASHWLIIWKTKRHISQLYFIPDVDRADINMDKAEINSSVNEKCS
jgi:hypothetical protein